MLSSLRPSQPSSSMDGESRPPRMTTGGMRSVDNKSSLSRPSALFRRQRTHTTDISDNLSERSATEATATDFSSSPQDSILLDPVSSPTPTGSNNTIETPAALLTTCTSTAAALISTVDPAPVASVPRPPKSLVRQLRQRASSLKSKVPFLKSTKKSKLQMMDIDDDADTMAPHNINVLQWIERCCPRDVAPKILAFCGPQMASNLMATNTFWFHLIAKDDGTWRSLCEGMYKWKEGDAIPESWKSFYRMHPCVPVDYPSIPRAMAVANAARTNSCGYPMRGTTTRQEQVRSVHILLRPGTHLIHHSLTIQTVPLTKVTMETLDLPSNRFYSPRLAMEEYQALQMYPTQQASSSSSSISRSGSGSRTAQWRERLGCRSRAEGEIERAYYNSEAGVMNSATSPTEVSADNMMLDDSDDDASFLAMTTPPQFPKRATLVFKTRRANEPIFRVRQGTLSLKNVDLRHSCSGLDIWNGNAAIQVQPPLGQDDQPLIVFPRPTAMLDGVAVTSDSGRGIVNIDGGHVSINSSCIHACAATGIYIGGPGSQAEVEKSDIIGNGIGSRQRRGIAAGHSGIYLEQGLARIVNCNVSANSLTGISSVSPDNAILWLENSDLMANGSYPLEMPHAESQSRRSSVTKNNNLAPTGQPEMRSKLSIPKDPKAGARNY